MAISVLLIRVFHFSLLKMISDAKKYNKGRERGGRGRKEKALYFSDSDDKIFLLFEQSHRV